MIDSNLNLSKSINFSHTISVLSRKYKSINRAIRRGLISSSFIEYPKRPFNNRKGKKVNELKKILYFRIKEMKLKNKDIK